MLGATPAVDPGTVAAVRGHALLVRHLRSDGEGVGVEAGLATRPDLLVGEGRGLGRVQGDLDSHGLSVHLAGADLGHVCRTVDLLVVLIMLVVVVAFER